MRKIQKQNAAKKDGSIYRRVENNESTLIDNIRNKKNPGAHTRTRIAPKLSLGRADLHAERPRRPRQSIISQYLNAACKTSIVYTRCPHLPRSASTLLSLSLSSCFFPPPFLFLAKKRRSLPAYLEAMRYRDAGRAPERNDVLIRAPIAERKRRGRKRIKCIKINFILRY